MVTVADTAFSIAVVRAEESERPEGERLFDDPYAALFRVEDPEVREATQRYLDLPFFREGIRLRTRFIDDTLRAHAAEGLEQVVILGAGFDTRALRMPELAKLRVFEIDFADQLARKRAFLEAGGVTLPDSVTHLPCDFTGDWEKGLRAALETRVPTTFVWEGVIGYIDGTAIDRSLAFMASLGARVVFTYGDAAMHPDPLEQRTSRAGFRHVEHVGCDELWRRHLGGEPHPVLAASRLAIASV